MELWSWHEPSHADTCVPHAAPQRIISNDAGAIAPGAPLYACVLTPQGRHAHDLFLHAIEGGAAAWEGQAQLLFSS
jgi:hypothetical protein